MMAESSDRRSRKSVASETRRLRILHLEDNRDDAAIVDAVLRRDGFGAEIRRVDSAQDFEQALRHSDFDVILADYNLPSFDGIAAQKRAAALRPDVPFIFLSGSIGEDEAIERVKAGATDYVLKDRIGRLPAAVRRALAEAATRADRERADAEVRRLNADLERRVIERTEQLQAARSAAERANQAKSEFLSRMSHELRTPLNAILGFAQLLNADDLPDNRREHVQQILNGGRHLLDLINEVLDVARIEAGHLTISCEPVNTNEIVRYAIDLVAPLAAERGITLSLAGSAVPEWTVLADRQRLNQILLNLLSNAVKYNRPGGRVTIDFEPRPSRRLRINVIDGGPGIPPASLHLLFNPFERLGAERSTTEGTGLGLTLSRGLARAMRGEVGAESRLGQGSTFWIELELTDEPVAVLPAIEKNAIHTRPAAATRGTVLYVEDNPSNVRLLQRVFERRPQVRLLHAASGRDAVAAARANRPDAIFLDLHLPDMSGETVLHLLQQDEALQGIPVAILSADATASQMERLLAAGATSYLTKPLDIRKILDLVDSLLVRR